MPNKKEACRFCGKKFHRKGVHNHEARCKSRPSTEFDPASHPPQEIPANLVAVVGPFTELIDAINHFHERLQRRLRELAELWR